MTPRKIVLLMSFGWLVLTVLAGPEEACTTAVIRPEASADGRPMLWKNRDTDILSNKVVFVDEQPFQYIALVNRGETSGRMVYAGLNDQGFAIMNSVAYNLEQKPEEFQDLEGQIMADALRTCRTVDDFARYIGANLGESLGSRANFGVIDARGQAVIFEVHNHGVHRLDAAEAPGKYLVNTNFARSGEPDEGLGILRFERATRLFARTEPGMISPSFIFRNLARDLGHVLLRHPTLRDLADTPADPPLWIYYRDCINRPYTSASVVVNGRSPEGQGAPATFWVILGEPVTSIAVPLWVESGSVPAPLWQGTHAPITGESLRIKKLINPVDVPEKEYYMKVNRLVNREKTGFLPRILETERRIFQQTERFLRHRHTPAELAGFQDRMAQQALAALAEIR